MSETYEERLNRLFGGWTNAEVTVAFEAIRDLTGAFVVSNGTYYSAVSDPRVRSDLEREYTRRAYGPRNVACSRCGSDNHTAENHRE